MMTLSLNRLSVNGFSLVEYNYMHDLLLPESLPVHLQLPSINAPPAHPGTVLTSVMYMVQSLTDLGMTYIHLYPDMQLYIQAMQIKWNEPQAFDKLILRPGVMHTVQNVCGCIGQLMMGSGLADLIGSAFGGVGSIMPQG